MDKYELAFYKIGAALLDLEDVADEDLMRLIKLCMDRLRYRGNNLNIDAKVSESHDLFLVLQHSLLDLRAGCCQEDLLVFNAESYVLYAGFFGELKLRLASEAMMDKERAEHRKGFTDNLMRNRFDLFDNKVKKNV